MSKQVAGQFFDVVSCAACAADLAFQNAAPSRRAPAQAGELAITCTSCGHEGLYHPQTIRRSQISYPL